MFLKWPLRSIPSVAFCWSPGQPRSRDKVTPQMAWTRNSWWGDCHYSNNLLQSLVSISIAEPTLRGTPLDPVHSVWLRTWCCPQLLHQLDPELNDDLFPQVTGKKNLTGHKCFLQLKIYLHKMWCSTLSQTYLPPKSFMQIVRPQSPIMFIALGTETESSLNVDLLIHLEITMMNSLQSNKK